MDFPGDLPPPATSGSRMPGNEKQKWAAGSLLPPSGSESCDSKQPYLGLGLRCEMRANAHPSPQGHHCSSRAAKGLLFPAAPDPGLSPPLSGLCDRIPALGSLLTLLWPEKEASELSLRGNRSPPFCSVGEGPASQGWFGLPPTSLSSPKVGFSRRWGTHKPPQSPSISSRELAVSPTVFSFLSQM